MLRHFSNILFWYCNGDVILNITLTLSILIIHYVYCYFSLSCILLSLVGIEILFNNVLLIILYIFIWILDFYTYTNRDSMFFQIFQGTIAGLIAKGDMQ